METYWLVAVLSLQVILPLSVGQGDDENPTKLVSNFLKVAADQLMNDPAFAEKLKDILADLREAFAGKEYQGTFIPAVVKMLDMFLNNGYFISPETVAKLMKSVINQATRGPDKFTNNLRRVGHRGVKLVGDTIKNVGSLGSSIVRVVEDAHNKQREYTDPLFAEIPYVGTVLQKINSAIAKVIGTVHMLVKLGVKGLGTIVSDFAEKRRVNLKLQTAEEKRAAQEAEEFEDEEEDEPGSDEEIDEDGKPKKGDATPAEKKDSPPDKKGEKEKPQKKKKGGEAEKGKPQEKKTEKEKQ